MALKKLIENYSSFNSWANHRMADWLLGLEDSLLEKHSPSSFPSINLTVQHLLRTQKFWTAFTGENDVSNFDWSVKEGEAKIFIRELVLNSEQMAHVFTNYSEADLNKELHLRMPWAQNNLSRFEYIIHVINHSTYHRGQIVSIARNLGIVNHIPGTDYNIFLTPGG